MNQFSGYIELTLDGEVMPFKFGTNAWALFSEKYRIELWQIGSSGLFGKMEGKKMVQPPDIIKLRDLFYFAYESACRARDEKPKINIFRFGDMLDEDSTAFIKLQETMIQSKMFGFTLVDLAEEDKKKAVK